MSARCRRWRGRSTSRRTPGWSSIARRLGVGRVIATEELERAQTEAAWRSPTASRRRWRRTRTWRRPDSSRQLETARQKQADARVVVPSPSPDRLPPGIRDPRTVRYVVAARKVSEGEMVRAMQSPTLVRLVIAQPLKLVVTVPEAFIGEIKQGQPVTLRVEAYPGVTFPGTVAHQSDRRPGQPHVHPGSGGGQRRPPAAAGQLRQGERPHS
ncbi:MAG: efflux RND transporter periplasmic adaptor subunit [Gemmataceae bacterium]